MGCIIILDGTCTPEISQKEGLFQGITSNQEQIGVF